MPRWNLIVQADLAVRLVLAAGNLHAVHAQVRLGEARLLGVLGIDLRQRDVRPAVVRPRFQLRQLVERRLVGQHRPGADFLRPGVQGGPRRFQIQPRAAQHVGRIDLQRHQPFQPVQRVAKDIPHPLHRAEQIADHREAAAFDAGEIDGRPAGAKHPPLNLGRLQLRIDRLLDAHQLARGR